MKRVLCLLLALCLLVCPALAVVDRPANGYVGDYAQVLDNDLEQEIIQKDKALFQSTGAEIVIISTEFLDGLDAESYAKTCFDAWGIGDGDRNNGLLLLFATDDLTDAGLKKCWVMEGRGLEGALSSATLNGWMEDYFYDDFDAGDYDAAVSDFFNAAYNWLTSYYAGTGQTVPEGGRPAGESTAAGAASLAGSLLAFTAVLIIIVAIVFIGSRAFRGRTYYSGYAPYRPWPRFFGPSRRYRRPPPPPRPPNYRPHTGGFRSGGVSRGGGVGRSGGSFRSSGGFHSSSGGGFHSGGGSRGGGVGRR